MSFPIPSLNTLRHSFLSYAADIQINKQTQETEHATHADIVGRRE